MDAFIAAGVSIAGGVVVFGFWYAVCRCLQSYAKKEALIEALAVAGLAILVLFLMFCGVDIF